jgi:hypothetical protein
MCGASLDCAIHSRDRQDIANWPEKGKPVRLQLRRAAKRGSRPSFAGRGVYLMSIMARLGIADAVKAKR